MKFEFFADVRVLRLSCDLLLCYKIKLKRLKNCYSQWLNIGLFSINLACLVLKTFCDLSLISLYSIQNTCKADR